MPAALFIFACSGCTTQLTVPQPEVTWDVSGVPTNVGKTFAWCHDCGTLVAAESLPSVERLREGRAIVVAELAAGNDGVLDYDDPPEVYDRLLAWRGMRVSPARCLVCEGTSIVPEVAAPSGGPGLLPHPGCTGGFAIVNLGLEQASPVLVLDSEGRRSR